jgi:TDG/mug DNA glycosylase family protein
MPTDYLAKRAKLHRSTASDQVRGSASSAAVSFRPGPRGKTSSKATTSRFAADENLGKRLRDRIAPGVRVLFVGINPGVRSAFTGHHFAGFSNRFWKLLYDSRLVPEPITYEDDDRLPAWGFGITNLVARPTPGIDTLRPDDYRDGTRVLLRKIARYHPPIVALIGVTVWRALLEAAGARDARVRPVALGFQQDTQLRAPSPCTVPAGTRIFVLPNPSGRNANYTYNEMLAAFRTLKRAMPRS